MRRAAIVVNPVSGRGAKARALVEFRETLEAAGVDVRLRETRGPGDGAVIAQEEAALGTDVVVAAGGDGTVNDVARGLVRQTESSGLGPPERRAVTTMAWPHPGVDRGFLGAAPVTGVAPALAILPRGTSNLVARDLGLPFRARDNARVVIDGVTAPMDVGFANGRLFVACVGVGWDAHVVRLLAQSRKGHITFATWAAPITQALFEYRFEPLRVVAADGSSAEGIVAMVFNTRPYAAFFTPVAAARRDDGLLDAIVLAKAGLLDLPRLTWKGLRGTLEDDASATVLRSTAFRIEAEKPLPVQIDGDVGGETPLDILVRPAALSVLVPAGKEGT